MQLSTKGRYAVMAMVELAKHGNASALPLAIIADNQNISIAYLEQLFLKLRRAGLVSATRGPKGGYQLTKTPAEISIADIMDAADEPVQMNRCTVEGADWCLGTKRCMTHDLWRALGDHIANFLVGINLQDVLDQKFTNPAIAAARASNKDIAARS